MEWRVGRRFKRERTYVYLWQTHVDIWQKPMQYCKAIILQLKIGLTLYIYVVAFKCQASFSYYQLCHVNQSSELSCTLKLSVISKSFFNKGIVKRKL